MLKKLNLIIQLFVIKKLLKAHCGEKVILVGTGAEKKSCFWITVIIGKNDYLGIEKFETDQFICRVYENNTFIGNKAIEIDDLVNKKLEFVHYFRHQQIELVGFYNFLIFFLPYKIIAYLGHYSNQVLQFLFNTRSLSSRKRHKFLAFLIKNFSGNNHGFSHIDTLQKLYGNRVFSHPDYQEIAGFIRFHLDGLVETKELEKDHQNNFHLTGYALQTLDEYEEEDRRHRSMNRAQWVLIILTIGLLFGTLVQANVIIIPTLFDFTETIQSLKSYFKNN